MGSPSQSQPCGVGPSDLTGPHNQVVSAAEYAAHWAAFKASVFDNLDCDPAAVDYALDLALASQRQPGEAA